MFNMVSHGGDIVKIIDCLYTQMQSTVCNILKVGSSPGSVCGDVIYFNSFSWLWILEVYSQMKEL